MFADDIKIYRQITSFRDALSLQNDLDKLCSWAKKWLLRFNITKCKHLKYGTIASPYEYYMNYERSNSKLSIVSSEKDLGVWITSKFNFTMHCDKASAKAMQSLGLIKRTFTHSTKESFLILYKSYIRPQLEYCVSIWNSYLARNIDKLERIQQRATKLVPELAQLRYEVRLHHLNLFSLYCRRQRGDLIEVYKLINHLNIISPDPFFAFVNSATRGHDYKIFKQHCRTTSRLNFFTNRIVNQWNALPQYVTASTSLNMFKNKLDQYWNEIGYGQIKRPLAYKLI